MKSTKKSRNKNKAGAELFCHIGSALHPPLRFSIICILICIFSCGCPDNRIRIKQEIPKADTQMQLYMMRYVYVQIALKDAEEYLRQRK